LATTSAGKPRSAEGTAAAVPRKVSSNNCTCHPPQSAAITNVAAARGMGRNLHATPITGAVARSMTRPHRVPAPGSRGDWMYRLVYWSGVTVFVVWSVFSALGALHAF
jgi:hypothetical protein